MISPLLHTYDLDSPSFATLCALVARRDVAQSREIHVLHDDGEVLSAVDTVDGPIHPPAGPVDDTAALAVRLREEHGADRVIVADARAVREMLAAAEAQVTPTLPQPALMLMLQQAFRDCAGVVADPPLPSLNSWRALERRLRDAGDGLWLLAAQAADGSLPIALRGELRDGLVATVTDADGDDVQAHGFVARLVVPLPTLEQIFTAADVPAAILEHLGMENG